MRAYRLFTTSATDGRPGATDGVAVSSTNTYYSAPVTLAGADGLSVSVEWSGTPSGLLTLWKSNKPDPVLTDDSDWQQETDALTDPFGSASKTSEEYGNFRASLVRLKYVNSSGSGTLKAYANVNRS
jgi:hypothetical protein